MTIKYLGNSSYESDDRHAVIIWKGKEKTKAEKVIEYLEKEGWERTYGQGDGIDDIYEDWFPVDDKDSFNMLKADYLRIKRMV